MSAHPKYETPPSHKICLRCGKDLPASEYNPDPSKSKKIRSYCKKCDYEASKEWKYRTGVNKPCSENKSCPAYLGVHITESLLSSVFDNVTRMKNGNSGYDFVCGKGYKIDAKSACTYLHSGLYPCWTYKPNRNTTADYFACLAFDNRVSLTPLHFWLFPGRQLSDLTTLCIYESKLHKFSEYERPLNKIIDSCNVMRCKKTGGASLF